MKKIIYFAIIVGATLLGAMVADDPPCVEKRGTLGLDGVMCIN